MRYIYLHKRAKGKYDRQQALAAGFQQHISKPVEPEELVKTIATLVKRRF